jgi:uncharacterized protein YprB with RNaseH-like and TPR domain
MNPKIGYFDIEAGGLKANFDYMLTYAIKTRNKEEYHTGIIQKKNIQNYTFDKDLLKQLIKDLYKYDIIMTYYGTRYDIPFIRTRAMSWNLDFPVFGEVKHKDVYYMVRNKMCLHKNSLESACAILNIPGKNHIKGNYWMRAIVGDSKALDYVMSHNLKDVRILEKLHKRLEVFVKPTVKSL